MTVRRSLPQLAEAGTREREIEKTADLGHLLSGNTPGKPTLVAIKGTVFDVSKNDAYGPKGQYHGKIIPGDAKAFITRFQPAKYYNPPQASRPQLTFLLSIRRQRPLPRAGAIVSETRRLPTGLVRSTGSSEDGAGRVVYFLQQEI